LTVVNLDSMPSASLPTQEKHALRATQGRGSLGFYHINLKHNSHCLAPDKTFVNKSAKFDCPSSFPTQMIPAAAAS
jgi:hypothetical protein